MGIKKVFITFGNFKKILVENNEGEEYIEIKHLKFLSNSYLKFIYKYINGIKNQQLQPIGFNEKKSNEWVFEGGKKSVYHFSENCIRLHSNYENYQINLDVLKKLREQNPNITENEIHNGWDKWENKKEEFRKWVLVRLPLKEKNKEEFFREMKKVFGVSKFGNEIHNDNTGLKDFYGASLTEIEEELNRLVKNRNDLVNKEYTRIEKIIIQFLGNRIYFFKKENLEIEGEYKEQDKETFWKKIDSFYEFDEKTHNYKSKNHKKILEKYGYENIIKLIYSYDDNNIQKIKDLLIFYINAKYNPNLSFDEEILKDLGFNVCSECKEKINKKS